MQVLMYTTAHCGYCTRAEQFLLGKGAQPIKIRIDEDPQQREIMLARSRGYRSVPQIFIGDYHVGGYHDLLQLERDGELDALLGNASN